MSDILIPPVPHFVCRCQELEDTVKRIRDERQADQVEREAEREEDNRAKARLEEVIYLKSRRHFKWGSKWQTSLVFRS